MSSTYSSPVSASSPRRGRGDDPGRRFPKTVRQVLGHASAGFTLTVYGHLFPDEMDRLAEALEAVAAVTTAGRDGTETGRAWSASRVDGPDMAIYLREHLRAGEDSNLRPAD